MTENKTYPIQAPGKGPRRAKIPTHRAQRWLSESENGRKPIVEVFVTQAAYQHICAHAASDMDNEVGGWLAGRWCRDAQTKTEFVVVEALLPAQQVRSGSTFLTFTHDSQVAMLAALEERYAKKGVVGWYHTHPRMGLFLSGYDTWLHSHFFPQPWQVALVVEPHSGIGGFFIRDKDNQLDARKYFGFYELRNRRADSVMTWKNLHAEKVVEPKKEEPAKIEVKKVAPEPVRTTESFQVVVEPKAEVKPQIKNGLERKPFKELVAEPKPLVQEPIEIKKPAPARVEGKTAEAAKVESKKIEIKTGGQKTSAEKNSTQHGTQSSEEAKS